MPGGTILILEDDPFVAEVYERALREDGNDVTLCRSYLEAREQLRQHCPDAVLTDIRVGEYNGLQLALLFRTYSPDGRLVVVTAYDDMVIRKQVGRLHGKFLVKPVKLAWLKKAFAPSHQVSPAPTR